RHGGCARRRTTQATDGNRRQVPGASHPDVGNPHRDQGRGLISPVQVSGSDRVSGAETNGRTRNAPRSPMAAPANIPAAATKDASASVETPVSPCPIEQPNAIT